MNTKKCSQSLEKILPLLELSKDDNDDLILHSGDITSITVGNFRMLGAIKKLKLIEVYKKHVPECDECKNTYINFLKSLEYNDIKKADKKYFNLDGFI